MSFKPEDMVTAEDTTPEHAKACQELWEKNGGFYNAGPFTPWSLHEDGTPPKSSIQFPGGTGGVNWGGTAADPKTGYVFLNTHDGALTGWMEKKEAGRELRTPHGRLEPALRSRQRGWAGSISRLQRDRERRERQRPSEPGPARNRHGRG